MEVVTLHRAAHGNSCSLDDGLLCLWLRIFVVSNLRLNNWSLFDNYGWLDDWGYLCLDHAFTKMVEDDFAQLNSLGSASIVEMKLNSLCIAVDLRKLNYVPCF